MEKSVVVIRLPHWQESKGEIKKKKRDKPPKYIYKFSLNSWLKELYIINSYSKEVRRKKQLDF